MIGLGYFLQLLVHALAWAFALTIAGCVVWINALIIFKVVLAVNDWSWRRDQARGIRRRFGARG